MRNLLINRVCLGYVILILLLLVVGSIHAQVVPPLPTDNSAQYQQQIAAFRAALASKMNDLGKCQTELGPLTQLQASVLTGALVDAKQAQDQFKTEFEKANPGKSLDVNDKIIEVKVIK
jgi:hypothetical protein